MFGVTIPKLYIHTYRAVVYIHIHRLHNPPSFLAFSSIHCNTHTHIFFNYSRLLNRIIFIFTWTCLQGISCFMEFDEDDISVGGLVPQFGAIFMSNSATKKECLKRKIFGLPLAMANFVKQVKSGMILFLFEYEKRELYGVFQATSDGTMNLKPQAFTSSGKQFPAQVQIAPIWSCRPLSEAVFRDAIKDNYYSPNKFHFGLSEQQVRVLLHLFYLRRLNNGIPDYNWTRKRKINDDGRFPSCDASESEVPDNWPSWHATSADCGGDALGTKNSTADSTFLINSRFSTENIDNSLIGLVGADREPLMIEDRFKSVHNFGDGIEPDFLNSRFSTEHIGKSLIGLVRADREPLMIEDRPKSVHNIGDSIEPNFLPVFPSYITLSEDVADDYRFSKDDGVENACDVESCIRPNFSSGLVSNNAMSRTVPYDPEFPDINYQCPSQVLNSAQDLSSHQVHDEHFLPLSVTECVPQEAAFGSLYSEAPVVKASVFSRLSVAPRIYKKEDNGISDEDGRLASIDEIMNSLHQAHNCWVKGKPSVGAKSRYVYVRCKEESKFPKQSQSKQSVVGEEMETDVNFFLEEDSDVVWKETRVVDFKRRSERKKNLDEMASKVSAGTTRALKTSNDATGKDLADRAGKTRKLIRPDFRKKQSHESTENSPSASTEVTTVLGKFEGRERIDEINSQDHKEVAEVGSGANDCEQKSSLQLGSENRVHLLIQDSVSSLASGSSAQEQPPYISGVAAVRKNLEKEEAANINHQIGNGDTLEQQCSLQSLTS